jgi:hypothetical protein
MQEGDGLALEAETLLTIADPQSLHVIMFDLPAVAEA